jgi:hypothetical protein
MYSKHTMLCIFFGDFVTLGLRLPDSAVLFVDQNILAVGALQSSRLAGLFCRVMQTSYCLLRGCQFEGIGPNFCFFLQIDVHHWHCAVLKVMAPPLRHRRKRLSNELWRLPPQLSAESPCAAC